MNRRNSQLLDEVKIRKDLINLYDVSIGVLTLSYHFITILLFTSRFVPFAKYSFSLP